MSIVTISQLAVDRKAVIQIPTITGVLEDQLQVKSIETIPTSANPNTTIENALTVLFSYIPTEIIALYVAVISTLSSNSNKTGWITFIVFLVFTPIVVWLVYAAKIKKITGSVPFSLSSLPLWEMIASTLAFIAWAFALPNSVFQTFSWYNQSVSGLGILLTSTILSLIAPFFNKS